MKTINRWMSLIIAVVMVTTAMSIQKLEAVPAKDFVVEKVSVTKSNLKKGDKFGLRVDFKETGQSPEAPSEIEFDYADFSGNNQIDTGDSKKQVSLSGAGADRQLHIQGLTFLGGDGNIKFTIHATNVSGAKEVSVKLDLMEIADEPASLQLKDTSQISIIAGATRKVDVEIENTGGATVNGSLISVTLEGGAVEGISLIGGKNMVSSVAPKSTSKGSFEIKTSKIAKAGHYKLKFDLAGKVQVISLHVTNDFVPPELKISIDESKEIKPGIVQQIQIKVENIGGSSANQVKVEFENKAEVEVIGEGYTKNISKIGVKQSEHLTYKIKVSPSPNQNKLPIKITYTYKDERGEVSKNTEQYIYIPLKNEISKNGEMVIENIIAPKGKINVGQNFNIKFTLAAIQGDVKNVRVSVSPENPSAIVPQSQNVFTNSNLKKGFKRQYSVSMSATASAGNQNHPIKIEVTYDSATDQKPVTFKQYTSVDIDNPEIKDEDDKEDGEVEPPKVIVGDYKITPVIVKNGEDFELEIGFLNTSETESIHGLKVNLKVNKQGEDDHKSIFTPVNATTTFYTSSLEPKEMALKNITMHTDVDARERTYLVQLELDYKDSDGNEMTRTESIEIPVEWEDVIEDEVKPEEVIGDAEDNNFPLAGSIAIMIMISMTTMFFYKKKSIK